MSTTNVGEDSRFETLVRQVQTKTKLEGKDVDNDAAVSFGKLMSTANGTEKCRIYIGWFFAAITGAILPLFFFFIGPVFDSFAFKTPEEAKDEITDLSLIMLYLAVGIAITSFFQNWLLISTGASIAARMKTKYLKAVLDQESAWYDQKNYMELASRLAKDVDSIQTGISQKAGQVLYAFMMCFSGLAVGFVKGWSLAFAMLAIGPVMMIGMGIFGEIQQKNTLVSRKAYSQSAGYAEQALQAIRIVACFGQEKLEIDNYNRFLARAKEAGLKQGGATGMSLGFFYFCIYFCYFYCFLIGAVWIDEGYWNHAEDRTYRAGDCMAVFFGVLIGLFALGGAAPAFTAINTAKVAGKSAFEVIDRTPEILQDDNSASNHDLQGEIKFENVTFFYPSRPDQAVMKNFDCTFELGKTTAIVGPSGSGKSTTIQLTERFYDPNEGRVLIDGKDLKSINLRNYRQQIGYVGQEPVLFNTTIKQNILMGKPDATDAEIEEALRKTNAWDFVNQTKDGINANVGAGGGQLSGGQKQRIALARAFIKKPRVLIFDEATSALDKKNEAEVQAAIDQMKRELGSVTSIVIAHRLTTVKNADRIVVMKKGKIVEDGNHDELVRIEGGIYAKMASTQAKSDDQPEEEEKVAAPVETMVEDKPADEPKLKRASTVTQINMNEVKETDPVARQKLQDAEKMRIEKEQKINDDLDYLYDEAKQDATFRKKVGKFMRPTWKVVISLTLTVGTAIFATLYGWWIMKTMSEMNMSIFNPDQTTVDAVLPWCMVMLGAAFALLICKSFSGLLLAQIAEEITQGFRAEMYESVVRKPIGWHDKRENGAGIMTATLSSDVQLLNGFASDGVAVMVEAGVAVLTGLIFSAIFSWPILLVGLGVLPLFMISGIIVAKADNENMLGVEEAEMSDDVNQDQKAAQILSSDSIQNYKTVASFGNDQILLDEFDKINLKKANDEAKSALIYAFGLGLSTAVQNGMFGIFYYATGLLVYNYPDYEYTQGDKMYMSMFVFLFGAFTAAQSMSMGPDAAKAKKAGLKIFAITDRPSDIDALSEDQKSAKSINSEAFQGTIEFKDVWFRYPARLQQWVFKGLNLKIEANDNIAVVGESGQGKSTFINLVMRFYDVEFGTVLVDGVDVKQYNVVDLRRMLGLVMQEPQLFNYSIAENMLYGDLRASNQRISESSEVANCKEFIESQEMSAAFDDSPTELLAAVQSAEFADKLKAKLGQEEYDQHVKTLTTLKEKEEAEGKFEAVVDLIDTRSAAQKGDVNLHHGYSVMAGIRGSKLSGGQKQRVAIARAVIRQPKILLLDEATSALDEESQKKVQAALEQIMGNRTSIVVAHRLTTVQKCNRLAVIDNGKIVEEGKMEDINAKSDGFFANLKKGLSKADKAKAEE